MSGSIGSLFRDMTVVGESYKDLLMTHNRSIQRHTLGELRMTAKNGMYYGIYQYIKASEALSRGEILTEVPVTAWSFGNQIKTDGAVVAAEETMTVDGNGSATTVITVNQFKGYWISQAPAAGPLGGTIQIKSHPALAAGTGDMELTLERPAGEAFADNVSLYLSLPYLMELVDATTESIMGVCVEDMTIDYFGWMQVGGFVPAVLVGHSGSAAVVLHEPLTQVGSGLPGACQGFAGNSDADIMESFLSPLTSLVAVAGATVCYIPARMKFSG